MAAAATSSISALFTPQAFARRNGNRSSKTRNPKFQKPVLPVPGGEATTYTRLPLKHDYSAPSPLSSPEIKLSGKAPPATRFLRNRKRHNQPEDVVVFEEYSDSEPESDGDYEFSGDENVDKGEEETPSVKEKGVPAVMRCFDRAKIYVKAGDGGNGVVAFRREKYVPMGDRRGAMEGVAATCTWRSTGR